MPKRDGEAASRRGFLQGTAGALGSLPGNVSNPAEPATFQPPRKLSPNLFVFEDTCNVYVVKNGGRGLLIDFGSGAILSFLGALGITRIDWILHTHHHRDQAQGDPLANEKAIEIAVPLHERQYFEDAENFWSNRRIFELYDVHNDFRCLTTNVRVNRLLDDYSELVWGNYSFFVQPTPGHTPGSVSLIATIDSKRVAFTGDLIHSAGKVQTLYDLQYGYGEHEGVDLSIYSLTELLNLKPDLVCPSHGDPLGNPAEGIKLLSEKLREWHRFWYKHPPTADLQPVAISPHLVACTETTSSFYAVISDSGKALFIDYGGASWTFFQVFTRYVGTFGRMRFLEHSIRQLRDRFGLKSIDVAIPSHMHDDHLNGFPHLVRRYGTKIWAHECMVDILERPRDLNVGCIFGEPVRINRVLRDRESFTWEGFKFTVVHSPGHTNYEMAMFATIDGQRIGFTGDAFFSDSDDPQSLRHNLIYRNQMTTGDYLRANRNLLEFKPDVIAPGHGKPFRVTEQNFRNFALRATRQDDLFRELVADQDTDLGLDPSWLRIIPYQIEVRSGQATKVAITLRNLRRTPLSISARPVLPKGWSCSPSLVSFTAEAKGTATAEITIQAPGMQVQNQSKSERRRALALDVVANGKYLGQISEAVIDLV